MLLGYFRMLPNSEYMRLFRCSNGSNMSYKINIIIKKYT